MAVHPEFSSREKVNHFYSGPGCVLRVPPATPFCHSSDHDPSPIVYKTEDQPRYDASVEALVIAQVPHKQRVPDSHEKSFFWHTLLVCVRGQLVYLNCTNVELDRWVIR